MRLTIKNRAGMVYEFSRPGRFYIFVDTTGNRPGTLGQQITERGGHTIGYEGDDPAEFSRICRNWYRQMKRIEAKYR